MNPLAGMTIKARLSLNLFLLCTLLLVAGGLGIYGTVVNHGLSERIVSDEVAVVVIGRINVKVFDSRLHIAQAQLNTEPANLLKEGKIIQENNAETARDLAELQQLAAGTDKAAVVEGFVKTVSSFLDHYLRPIESALLAGNAQQFNEIINTAGNKHYSPIKQSRTELMQAIEQSTERHRSEAKKTYDLTLRLIGLLVGTGLLLAIGVGLMISRSISRDTASLLDGMLHVQQDHDLSYRLTVSGQDEISQIGLHAGSVVEGLLGSETVKAYEVIGDAVNTASRICSAAAAGELLVSTTALPGLSLSGFPTRQIAAKGKLAPIEARVLAIGAMSADLDSLDDHG